MLYEILGKRIEDTKDFLQKVHPIVKEQRHLDYGTLEQAYWHYGYLIALRDVLMYLARWN